MGTETAVERQIRKREPFMRFRQFLFAAVVTALASMAFAAPGDLDTTFNGTGNLIINFSEDPFWGGNGPNSLLAIQPNGKILAMSAGGPGYNDSPISIARLNASGTYDQSFGTGGKQILNIPTWGRGVEMILQPDGKILITGHTSPTQDHQFSCSTVRLNSDGSLDTSFNGTGLAVTPLPSGSCFSEAIAVQPDGKIVTAGRLSTNTAGGASGWFTLRYNSDGTADTSYGTNGLSTVIQAGRFNTVKKVMLQPDGKILACGTVQNPSNLDFAIARFNATGGLDTSYGVGGIASALSPPNEFASDAVMQPDGKIVFVGNRWDDFTVARVNTDGTLDTSFGSAGFRVTSESGIKRPEAVALQPDGKILVGGVITINDLTDYVVARFNSDGSLDQLRPVGKPSKIAARKESVFQPLWGSGGLAIGGNAIASDTLWNMTVDAAGRVVISGNSYFTSNGQPFAISELSLARFLGESAPTANIYGTIKTAGGMPIRNVSVVLSEGGLSAPVYALTNQFGLYSFPGLQVTERYSVSISSKRFNFVVDQKLVTLLHDEESIDFTAEP